jgi:hypothetical protein
MSNFILVENHWALLSSFILNTIIDEGPVFNSQGAYVAKKRGPKPKLGASFPISKIRILAHHDNVGGLGALGPLGDFKLDLIAFVKHFKPVLFDGGEMHEDVISIVSGNEPVALFFIKPFHSTFGHHNSPPLFPELK